jgi:hypothetical protein
MANHVHTTGGGAALALRPISNPTSTLSTDQPFSRRVDRLLFTESVNEWIELILAGAADATDDEIAPHLAAGLAAPLAASRVLAGRVVGQ